MASDDGNGGSGLPGFLGDRVVVELRRLIATGAIAPGDHIVEREVAERLGTSRGPVREAIRTLQHEGLVEVTRYAGACVARIDREEIDEIVALRRQVEYFSIAGATLRASEQETAALRELAIAMGPVCEAEDVDRLLELDLQFHLGICACSHHATLAVTMRTLYPRLAILFHPQMLLTNTPASIVASHERLVDAIEGGDIDASLAAIDEHIDHFYTDIELRIDGGRRRAEPTYVSRVKPARPVAMRRHRGTLY